VNSLFRAGRIPAARLVDIDGAVVSPASRRRPIPLFCAFHSASIIAWSPDGKGSINVTTGSKHEFKPGQRVVLRLTGETGVIVELLTSIAGRVSVRFDDDPDTLWYILPHKLDPL
jgi:hypothetical protein